MLDEQVLADLFDPGVVAGIVRGRFRVLANQTHGSSAVRHRSGEADSRQ